PTPLLTETTLISTTTTTTTIATTPKLVKPRIYQPALSLPFTTPTKLYSNVHTQSSSTVPNFNHVNTPSNLTAKINPNTVTTTTTTTKTTTTTTTTTTTPTTPTSTGGCAILEATKDDIQNTGLSSESESGQFAYVLRTPTNGSVAEKATVTSKFRTP